MSLTSAGAPHLAPDYSFRRALDAGAFAQFPLLGLTRVRRDWHARGLRYGHLRERLEALDEVGALRPVLFEFRPATGSRRLGQHQSVRLREEHGFESWGAIEATQVAVDGTRRFRLEPMYSRWQWLYAESAIDLGEVRVSVDSLLAPGGFTPEVSLTKWMGLQKEAWTSLDDRWRAVVLILTRLQGRYGPKIKGDLHRSRSITAWDAGRREFVDPYPDELRSFDPRAVLDELALSTEEIERLYRHLASRALVEDPLERWHPLSRMAPFEQRQKLKGEALRAQDGYDAAEMLRRFYYDLTGELLPEADEPFDLSDKSWKQRLYGGKWPVLGPNYRHLSAVLRRLGLWPLQVHLVLEGETEEEAARELFRIFAGPNVDLGSLGISITTLQGVDKVKARHHLLALARVAVAWTVVICDREGDAEKAVQHLVNDGLIDEEKTKIWDRTFEEDNFTDDELVATIVELGAERGVDVRMDASEARGHHSDSVERGGKKGFASFLIDLARRDDVGPVVIRKPDLARALAQRMVDGLNQETLDETTERRPFLGLILGVLRVV